MNREELEVLTKDDLREHAETLGIKLGSLDSKGTMVDKILGEYKEPEKKTVVPIKDEKLPPMGGLYDLAGNKISGRKYNVTIMGTENDNSDVPLIVNGHNIVIKRNVEVVIDEAYVEVLKNAVIDTVIRDPDTKKDVAQKRVLYPYQAILV